MAVQRPWGRSEPGVQQGAQAGESLWTVMKTLALL